MTEQPNETNEPSADTRDLRSRARDIAREATGNDRPLDDSTLRGIRWSLTGCAILAAIGIALGSPGVPTLPDSASQEPGDTPTTTSVYQERSMARSIDTESLAPVEMSTIQLRDLAFARFEDGDARGARRAAARFLLRPRHFTRGVAAERPDVLRLLGQTLHEEAMRGSGTDHSVGAERR